MFAERCPQMLEILTLEHSCTGCGACVGVCPKSALSLSGDKEGFYYPSLEASLCIDCRLCEKCCPVISRTEPGAVSGFRAYMGRAVSMDLVAESSSGGIFSLLAENVLRQGGVVYGARYNYQTERLEHASTDDFPLAELRKSKYIESFVGDTFREVKSHLGKGRRVLFCGTPCQVIGLKSFLGRGADDENLLLLDFICHGVPSNRHFTEYKHYVERKYRAKIAHLDFRPKNHGWRTSNIVISWEDGRQTDIPWRQSLYYAAFQSNMGLRKSCYLCDRVSWHESDITLGDFWGILNYRPEADDNKGISMFVVNGRKGQEAIDEIAPDMESEPLPADAVRYAYEREHGRYSVAERTCFSAKVEKYGYIRYMKRLFMPRIAYLKFRAAVGKIIKSFLKIK